MLARQVDVRDVARAHVLASEVNFLFPTLNTVNVLEGKDT
jgi:hypothetical protein